MGTPLKGGHFPLLIVVQGECRTKFIWILPNRSPQSRHRLNGDHGGLENHFQIPLQQKKHSDVGTFHETSLQ